MDIFCKYYNKKIFFKIAVKNRDLIKYILNLWLKQYFIIACIVRECLHDFGKSRTFINMDFTYGRLVMHEYDVVIIGAGTSGLTARREVAKKTKNYLIVDDGPLGTTCARVGCMPSKVLIQVANDFHQYKKLLEKKLVSYQQNDIKPKVNLKNTMEHVRALRDRFVRGVVSSMPDWQDHFLKARAEFIDKNHLKIGNKEVRAKKTIVATGSRPIIPNQWKEYSKFFIDTNSFFELENLPENVLVVGLGVIGLEIGQALSRLGINVVGVSRRLSIGGLTDPEIGQYAIEKLKNDFQVFTSGVEFIGDAYQEKISANLDGKVYTFDKVILSVGRRPNIDTIGIENLDVELDKNGIPFVDPNTMLIRGSENIFLPGDVNGEKAILHEAADEGKIAGYNSVNSIKNYKRRTPLAVTFSDPNIASVGINYTDLLKNKHSFVTGKVTFEGQGRSIVKLKEQGLLHVYVDKQTHLILGAEMQAPDGEHLAHLLSWVIAMKKTVFEVLRLPFYHPVIEEGLRTALRDAARQIDKNFFELEQI